MPTSRRESLRFCLWLLIAGVPSSAIPANAADWRSVASTDGVNVFVDRESVHEDRGRLKVWVLKDYPDIRHIGDDFYPHRSALMLYVVACDERKLGYTQWSLQSGNLGSGRTVWADHIGDVSFLDAGADDEHHDVFQTVCSTWKLRASAGNDAGTR